MWAKEEGIGGTGARAQVQPRVRAPPHECGAAWEGKRAMRVPLGGGAESAEMANRREMSVRVRRDTSGLKRVSCGICGLGCRRFRSQWLRQGNRTAQCLATAGERNVGGICRGGERTGWGCRE